MNYEIAGLSIYVEERLSYLLPRRMCIFSMPLSGADSPDLYVKASGKRFSSFSQIRRHIFLHPWHDEQVQTMYLPETKELLIEEIALNGGADPIALQYSLMQSIRAAVGLILLHRGGFILHASAVISPDKTLLFSGLSGSGKSTQALLWEKFRHAEILNHDAPMIVCKDGRYYCFGNPWSGSVDCYKQKSAPVNYLISLSHGTKNEISPLAEKDALRFLLTQSLVRLQNEEDMDLLVENMQRFLRCVPVFHFACKPDSSAVDTLNNYLTQLEEHKHA